MGARTCPQHDRVMDRLTVMAKETAEDVEIDRCPECGALWFDAGELEVIAELTARLVAGKPQHPCPVCREPMKPATVSNGIEAHRCDECHGTWLDGYSVKQLVRRELPSSVVKATGTVGFLCAGCGGRFPFADGNATAKGLVCKTCVVNPRPGRIPEGAPTGYTDRVWPRARMGFGVSDAIFSVALLFEDE